MIHLAAKVGGLYANMENKVAFYEDNMQINLNVIKNAYQAGVKTMVCVLSTCIYPDDIKYPICEEDLHKGPPHPSNEGYAYAKRMVEVQCRLYNEAYGTNYMCVVPTNIYGMNDQYDPKRSHVVSALIRKAYEAKQKKQKFVVYGSGAPLRQFCYTHDICKLLLWVLFSGEKISTIALFDEMEYSIRDVATKI